MRVEYAGALNRRNGGGDLRDLFRISTFAEVGYAFHEGAGVHTHILEQDLQDLQDACILFVVPQDRFVTQRKNAWQRLEELLKLLDAASLRRLGREEVRELGRIYRRTASDLAIARAESRDP